MNISFPKALFFGALACSAIALNSAFAEEFSDYYAAPPVPPPPIDATEVPQAQGDAQTTATPSSLSVKTTSASTATEKPVVIDGVQVDDSQLVDQGEILLLDNEEPFHDSYYEYYDIKHDRVDTHGPAGVMGDHVHEQGEWMFEYKFAQMYMDGNRVGHRRVTDAQAFNATGDNFPVTPTNMTMEMHMLHFMYGWTDNVTLYIMPTWTTLSMDHRTQANATFTTNNNGFGDLPFGFLWRFYNGETDELILNFGMSAPTGNISENVPGTQNDFPYPMRLGSGTFDFRPGITYKSYSEYWSFGAQFQTDLPVGRNYAGYQVGNQYILNLWWTYLPTCCKNLGLSYRIENRWAENFSGQDPDLNPALVSTARADFRGGYWLNFGYGAQYQFAGGSRLSAEMTHPIYQDLSGVQLETDWTLFVSWNKAF